MPKSLYICYFGVREPLVQTQVLPYVRDLVKGGVEMSLLTFEPDLKTKWSRDEIEGVRKALADEGIAWHHLAYHKWPSVPATAWDVAAGTFRVRRLLEEENYDILHGRVHLPTLMGAIARKFSRGRRPKLLFDIRGFFPEEYTDAGRWPEGGWLYRSAKRVERWLMKEADGFVVLTEKAREILFPESRETGRDAQGRPVEVIPCCVDLDGRFAGDAAEMRGHTRQRLGIDGRRVILHLGALGGLYLTERIADLLAASRNEDPSTFAMFLTQSDPTEITKLLRERGFTEHDIFSGRIPAEDVAAYLCAADVGISFVRAGFATQSRSPTKIPEYLACGLPIIANRGVGDVDELISENGVGTLIDDFSTDAYREAFARVRELNGVADHCRTVARREFDLPSVGGLRYRRLYELLAK